MKIAGEIINGCYKVVGKQYEDPLFEYWEAKSLFSNDSFILQFLRESPNRNVDVATKKAAVLFHEIMGLEIPGVIAPIEMGDYESNTFFTYPVDYGCSLQEFLEPIGTLPLALVVGTAFQIVNALAALHGVGLSHNALTPDNIWVDGATGTSIRVRLDNIYASLMWSGAENQETTGDRREKYLSLNHQEFDALSGNATHDLYSLGLILYKLAHGTLPAEPLKTITKAHLESVTARTGMDLEAYRALNALILRLMTSPESFENIMDVIGMLRAIEVTHQPGVDMQRRLKEIHDRYKVRRYAEYEDHIQAEEVVEELAAVTADAEELLEVLDEVVEEPAPEAPAPEDPPQPPDAPSAPDPPTRPRGGMSRMAAALGKGARKVANVIAGWFRRKPFAGRSEDDYRDSRSGHGVTGDLHHEVGDVEERNRASQDALEQSARGRESRAPSAPSPGGSSPGAPGTGSSYSSPLPTSELEGREYRAGGDSAPTGGTGDRAAATPFADRSAADYSSNTEPRKPKPEYRDSSSATQSPTAEYWNQNRHVEAANQATPAGDTGGSQVPDADIPERERKVYRERDSKSSGPQAVVESKTPAFEDRGPAVGEPSVAGNDADSADPGADTAASVPKSWLSRFWDWVRRLFGRA